MTRSLQATAMSSQLTVAIYGVAANAAGMGLDNVVLTAVPEPASTWMALAGPLGLAGARPAVRAAPKGEPQVSTEPSD